MDRLMTLSKAEHRQLHHELRQGIDPQVLASKYGLRRDRIQYHQKACAARDARFDTDPKDALQHDKEMIVMEQQPTNRENRKFHPEVTSEQIRAELKAGATVREVSEALGVSIGRVVGVNGNMARFAKRPAQDAKAGIPIPSNPAEVNPVASSKRLSDEDHRILHDKINEGVAIAILAERFGVKRQTIDYHVEHHRLHTQMLRASLAEVVSVDPVIVESPNRTVITDTIVDLQINPPQANPPHPVLDWVETTRQRLRDQMRTFNTELARCERDLAALDRIHEMAQDTLTVGTRE